MSEIQHAKGGDGWSEWVIDREPRGNYFIVVTSHAESSANGTGKILHVSEDIRNGRTALDTAIRVSSEYAHRMAS